MAATFERSSTKAINQKNFLGAYRYALDIKSACEVADISERIVNVWRRDDPEFVIRFDEAEEARGDFLEGRMFAILEWATSFDQYKLIVQKPALLMFALKASKREKYGERGVSGGEEVKKVFEALLALKDDPETPQDTALPTVLRTEIEEILERTDDA